MEAYDVTVELYDRTQHGREWFADAENDAVGICNVEIWRDKEGLIHREDGPALVMRDTKTGEAVAQGWYSRGDLHRDGDMPAAIWMTGYLRREWYHHGLLHRDAGPARLVTTPDLYRERTFKEDWYQNGKLHRVGGPASLMVSDWTGVVLSESWYQDGKCHRVDGPAITARNEETGVAYDESWFQFGLEYRSDGGPTHTSRNEKTGEIMFVHGPKMVPFIKPPSP